MNFNLTLSYCAASVPPVKLNLNLLLIPQGGTLLPGSAAVGF